MSKLLHRTVFEDGTKISKSLPLTEALIKLHPNGTFPLVEDPLVTKKATIIGMFVLRPADSSYSGPVLNESGFPSSLYDDHHEWTYNVNGLDGGWIIANSNSVDAYRLALQYGVSDAVITSSNAASVEGVANAHGEGYLWQPYVLGEWAQLKTQDPEIVSKIAEQRMLWQSLGYLSTRKYPAAIVFTKSGLTFEGSPDFLESRCFVQKTHPDGERMETYIMTSEQGAKEVRSRAAKFGLQDTIDEMLIVIPAPPDSTVPLSADGLTTDMDIASIPKLLHDKYDMKIVNHDGGQSVLKAFCRVGALSQMNITLCRHVSQKQVIETRPELEETLREQVLGSFKSRLKYFFSSPGDVISTTTSTEEVQEEQDLPSIVAISVDTESDATNSPNVSAKSATTTGSGSIKRSIPRTMTPVCVISDDHDEVAVVTFCTKNGCDFDTTI